MFTAILTILVIFLLFKFGILRQLFFGLLILGAMFAFGIWAIAEAELEGFFEYAMVGAMVGFPIFLMSYLVFAIVQIRK